MLLTEVDEKKVKSALFSMHQDKSPGPDGMTSGFYQRCWNIVKKDVVAVVNFCHRINRLAVERHQYSFDPEEKYPEVHDRYSPYITL